MNARYLLVLLSISVIVISACASQQTAVQTSDKTIGRSAESGKAVAVAIRGFKFVPAEVNIKVGEKVVWTNEDSAPHTVESADGDLRSDELSTGDTYSYTFTKSGKHDYICGIHPSMKGSVTVQ
ncbi:cupredoxin family copper-binding protein [Candidatus Woesearchaeota archaeon]|nr:cupredoxin family copper-binding protein [Candidatus Woesearchaeota archaeon]